MRLKTTVGASIPTPPVLQRLVWVWLGLALLSLLFGLVNREIARSVLWGISVCFAPTACFTWYVLRFKGARFARHTVNTFYRGEAIKFVLTAVLFIIVFQRAEELNVPVFFLAFMGAQLIAWALSMYSIGQRP